MTTKTTIVFYVIIGIVLVSLSWYCLDQKCQCEGAGKHYVRGLIGFECVQ